MARLKKALAIRKEIGDKNGEAIDYAKLGAVFKSLGNHRKAKDNYEKALAISKEIAYRQGEGSCYGNLGTLFQC